MFDERNSIDGSRNSKEDKKVRGASKQATVNELHGDKGHQEWRECQEDRKGHEKVSGGVLCHKVSGNNRYSMW